MNAGDASVWTLQPLARTGQWVRRLTASRGQRAPRAVARRSSLFDPRMATRARHRATQPPTWLRRAGSLSPRMVDRFAVRISERAVPVVARRRLAEPAAPDWPALDMPLAGMAATDAPPAGTASSSAPDWPPPGLYAASSQDAPARPPVTGLPPLGARRSVTPARSQAGQPPAAWSSSPPASTSPSALSAAPRPTVQRIRRYSRVEEIDPLTLALQNEQQRYARAAGRPSSSGDAPPATADQPAAGEPAAPRASEPPARSVARAPAVARRSPDAPAARSALSPPDTQTNTGALPFGLASAPEAPPVTRPAEPEASPRSVLQRMRRARAEQLRRQMERATPPRGDDTADAPAERPASHSAESGVESRPASSVAAPPSPTALPPEPAPGSSAPAQETARPGAAATLPPPIQRAAGRQSVSVEGAASETPPRALPAGPPASAASETRAIGEGGETAPRPPSVAARNSDLFARRGEESETAARPQSAPRQPATPARQEAAQSEPPSVSPPPAVAAAPVESVEPLSAPPAAQRQLSDDDGAARKPADARPEEGRRESPQQTLAALAERVVARAMTSARLAARPARSEPVAPARSSAFPHQPASRPQADFSGAGLPARWSDMPPAESPAASSSGTASPVTADEMASPATRPQEMAASAAAPPPAELRPLRPSSTARRVIRRSTAVLPQARRAEAQADVDEGGDPAGRLPAQRAADEPEPRPVTTTGDAPRVTTRTAPPALAMPATTLARMPSVTRRWTISDIAGEAPAKLSPQMPASPRPVALPLAGPGRAAHIRRAPAEAAASPPAPSAPESIAPAAVPDLHALARQVYPILKRMLSVERERLRGF